MRGLTFAVGLIVACLSSGAHAQELTFLDASKKMVFNNSDGAPSSFFTSTRTLDQKTVTYIKVERKQLIGDLTNWGRFGSPIRPEVSNFLKRDHQQLQQTLNSVNTSYEFSQNETKFFFGAVPNLKTPKIDINGCSQQKPCPHIFQIKLISFSRVNHPTYTIGLLTSIKPLVTKTIK